MSSGNGSPVSASLTGEQAAANVAAPPPPAPVQDQGGVGVVDVDDSPPLQIESDPSEGTHDDVEVLEVHVLSSPEEAAAAVEEAPGDVVAGPPSPHPQPEAGQAAGPVGEFVCDICHARYPTEKAMFGHLRCHKDRAWRGAFSPPTFSMEEFAEYQEHLVKSEEEQLREIEAEETALLLPPPGYPPIPHHEAAAPQPPPPVTQEAGECSQKVVLDVDLNVEVEEAVEEFAVPDLNLPPPAE